MKLGIFSLNVRGLHDPIKRKVVKFMVRKHKPNLVCVQETKMREMSNKIVRNLGVGRHLGWASLNARGMTRGVLLF